MFLTPALLQAQPNLEDENVLDNPVPFDGGVSCLVAATVVYGLRKIRSMKNSEQDKIIL
jgi:hypothetical protein